MKQSLYLETTIPSYLAARMNSNIVVAGKQIITQEFWEEERHKYDLVASVFVYDECRRGDAIVAKRRLELLKDVVILRNTPDIEPLADVYMRLLSIPQSKRIDALHLAMCCVHDINILLSWNCRHLGTDSMLLVKKHNDAHGLPTPQMITPDAIVNKYWEVDPDE